MTLVTLILYYHLFGRRHLDRRRKLAADLRLAAERVHELEEKVREEDNKSVGCGCVSVRALVRLANSSHICSLLMFVLYFFSRQLLTFRLEENEAKKDGKSVRIFMDGAFDMMHYGHMNAFRQGKALGTQLVVGINSDASIKACKGPPVMNDQER